MSGKICKKTYARSEEDELFVEQQHSIEIGEEIDRWIGNYSCAFGTLGRK